MTEAAALYDVQPTPTDEPDLSAYQETAAALIDLPDKAINYMAPAFDPRDPGGRVGGDLAPASVDGEWISLETRLQVLEQQAVECRNRYLHARFELGMVLMEHRDLCKEKTGTDGRTYAGRFDRLVAKLGISISGAYQHIAVAQTVQQIPALKDLAEANFQKLVAIAEGIDEEQIAQIASGNGPLTLDEIDQLSVRKLKARVRELTSDKDRIVKRATAALQAERDALLKERDKLAALTGDDFESLRKSIGKLREEVSTAMATLRGIWAQMDAIATPEDDDPRHKQLIALIDGQVRLLASIGQDLWASWFDKSLLDYGRDPE